MLDALSIREIAEVLNDELAGCAQVHQVGESGPFEGELRISPEATEAALQELERRGYRIVREL